MINVVQMQKDVDELKAKVGELSAKVEVLAKMVEPENAPAESAPSIYEDVADDEVLSGDLGPTEDEVVATQKKARKKGNRK